MSKKIAVPVEKSVKDTTKKNVVLCEIPTLLSYEKVKAGQEKGSLVRIAWTVDVRDEDVEVVPLCIGPDVARLIQEISRRISGRDDQHPRESGDKELWEKINSTGSHNMNLSELYDLSNRGKKTPRKKKVDLTKSTAERVHSGEITEDEGTKILMAAFKEEMENNTN